MIAAATLAPMLWAQGAFHRPAAAATCRSCSAPSILHLMAFSALIAAGLQFVPAGRAIVLGYTTPLWVAIGAAMFLSEHITRRRAHRDRLRSGGPRRHLQSADAELARPQRAVRQRPDPGRGVLLGRQHRLCPGAQMDLDALSARVLAGVAGGRAALGHRADRGRRAAHRVDRAVSPPCCSISGIVCTAFANWAMTMVNRSLPAVTTSLCLLATPLLGIVSATVMLNEPLEPSLFLAMTLIIGGIALGDRCGRMAAVRCASKPAPSSPRNTSPCRSGRAGSAACPRTRRIFWDRRPAARAGSR